jgi:hypothetical protein
MLEVQPIFLGNALATSVVGKNGKKIIENRYSSLD